MAHLHVSACKMPSRWRLYTEGYKHNTFSPRGARVHFQHNWMYFYLFVYILPYDERYRPKHVEETLQVTNNCLLLIRIVTLYVMDLSKCFKFCDKQWFTFFLFCTMNQQMHNNFTNFRTATCFDTIMSSSGSL